MLAVGVVAGLAAIGLVAGCSTDGRDLADAQPWQTTTSRPVATTEAPVVEPSASGMTLSSPQFTPGGALPADATCAGDNTFPTLAWDGVPDEAVELVVALSDQTDPAQPVLLWMLAGIAPSEAGLTAGEVPVGAFETGNELGRPWFDGPCLDDGLSRQLQFRLYALHSPSLVDPGEDGATAWPAIRARSIESASLLARSG
jgi:phosphatidylethanolamine-binding protein (PEBP) family uncharacterized protein